MNMAVIIGSARIDERGRASGGAAGDQKQSGSGNDYKGEVSMQNFYIHSKGWHVLRPKSAAQAEKIAERMIAACNNANIGYDQGGRLGIISAGIDTAKKTECDCSSLVRECVKEAAGVDPGNFTTASECSALEKTGLFEVERIYVKGTQLYVGDVLVTRTKGHTAIVVSGTPRMSKASSAKSLEQIATEVIAGLWGNGEKRKEALRLHGHDPAEVQKIVNRMLAK